MYKICVYAKRETTRKSLVFIVSRFPNVMKVVGECRSADECREWFKKNKADSIVTVTPPTIRQKEKFLRELRRKFPRIRVEGYTSRKIRDLLELYEFYDYSKDPSLPKPKRVPPLFPKLWLKARLKTKRT